MNSKTGKEIKIGDLIVNGDGDKALLVVAVRPITKKNKDGEIEDLSEVDVVELGKVSAVKASAVTHLDNLINQ
jgi:hypothetical protein